jgi:hypothetical protein
MCNDDSNSRQKQFQELSCSFSDKIAVHRDVALQMMRMKGGKLLFQQT